MARQYRTLVELRAEMRAMLGGGSTGTAAGVNATLLDTHLRNAQTLLYWTHDWAHLRKYEIKVIGATQTLIDYPTWCNPDRVRYVSVQRGTVWSPPLKKGITPQMYTYQQNPSWPQRWEPYDQIEVWPLTDQIYNLRIFGIKSLASFTVDQDRASVDDSAISIVATSTLKAHYRQPDSPVAKGIADELIRRLKEKSWGQDIFKQGDWTEMEPMMRPQRV
jgi:hypothetical protein